MAVDQDALAKAVKKAMSAGKVEVSPIESGVYVYAQRKKDDCHLKFELHDDGTINCTDLRSGGSGWLVAANTMVREVLGPDFGATHVVMDAGGERARKTLTKYAPYKKSDRGLYRWDI